MATDVFKREDTYMAGGYIPRQLLDELNLLSLYLNAPKAHIFRELIEKRIAEEDNTLIIHILAQRAIKGWGEVQKKKKTKTISFATYEDEIEQRLTKKNIAPAHIQQIIMEMRKIHAENKRD